WLISHSRNLNRCIRIEIMTIGIFPMVKIYHRDYCDQKKQDCIKTEENFLPKKKDDNAEHRIADEYVGKNFELNEIFIMQRAHADIMIQTVNDIDIPGEFVCPDLHF